MLNRFTTFSKLTIYTGLLAACALIAFQKPAYSVEPQIAIWGTFGNDLEDSSDFSYGVGTKAGYVGLEVGWLDGDSDSVGVDALGFLPLEVVSPYLGLGLYGDGEGVGYSGGVHINTRSFLFGVGYHSIRGLNGQIGIQLN